MRLITFVVTGMLSLGIAGSAVAQSLAEAAAKEKERRKGGNDKVITESDLRKAGAGDQSFESDPPADGSAAPAAADGTAAPAGAKDAAKPEKSDADKRAERGVAIQKELTDERAHIADINKDIALREGELAGTADSAVEGRRAQLLKYIADAKAAIATHQAQIDKLSEEARRSGISVY
jgi:hypothetical protein